MSTLCLVVKLERRGENEEESLRKKLCLGIIKVKKLILEKKSEGDDVSIKNTLKKAVPGAPS